MTRDPLDAAGRLAAAIAVGLLIGLERGWRDRELPDGGRVAGLRTFALIALLGGLLGLAGELLPLGLGLVAVAVLFAASYPRASSVGGTLSITTAVAALVTFALGALAAGGQAMLAVGIAVVVALLLDLKGVLHGWLRRIQPAELNAILQLGVLSAVILPLLPNEGLGPYGAVNPFKLWLAVVVIATLSLSGHVATRLRGSHQGLLWVGLLGGLASSTAATLTLARFSRRQPELSVSSAAGILAASGVMFVRMAVVVMVLQPSLAIRLGGLLLLLAASSFAAASWVWRAANGSASARLDAETRVFDLPSALGFGAALGVISVAVRIAKEELGTGGVYGVAFVSGLADVDAILISSLQMHAQGVLGHDPTGHAILFAVLANMLVKGAMAWTIGSGEVGRRVLAGYGFIGLTAALAAVAGVV